jgi:Ribosomal protein L10
MAKSRQLKEKLFKEYQDSFKKSSSQFLTYYNGIETNDLASLRKNLHENDSEFVVVKNRVVKKALQEVDENNLIDDFSGPIGVTFVNGDPSVAAKKIIEFTKENDNFKFKSASIEGSLVDEKQFKQIADLPSKEVLLTSILSSIVSPHRNLQYVLKGVSEKLVRVISAIKDQKS